jgi:hypothetical protein
MIPVSETWKDVYASSESLLTTFAEKLKAIDKLFNSSNEVPNPELETMFSDIFADFRTIQKLIIRVKTMPVADDAELLERNEKVTSVANYLVQESHTVRTLQHTYMVAKRNQENLQTDLLAVDEFVGQDRTKIEFLINEVKQEMARQQAIMASRPETLL